MPPSPRLTAADAAPSARRLPSLVAWLFGSAVLTAVLAISAVALMVDRGVQQQAREEAVRLLRLNAHTLRDGLDTGMRQHFDQVLLLSRLYELSRLSRASEVRAAMDSFVAGSPQFAWVGLTDPEGRVLAASQGLLEGADVSSRAWFKAGVQGPFVGDVHDAVLLARLLPSRQEPWRFVDFAFPVKDGQGRLAGVVGSHLSWTWAAELKRQLSDQLAQEVGAQAIVLSADGTVLLGPPDMQAGQRLPADATGPGYLWAQAASQGSGGKWNLGWRVVVRQPAELALAPYVPLRHKTLAASLLVLGLLMPLLWWMARRLARPLAEITRAIDDDVAPATEGASLYREASALRTALVAHVHRHDRQSADLAAMAQGLEQRVQARTAELAATNARLLSAFAELERSQARLASILAQSPDAFVSADDQGRIKDWNPAAEALLGWRHDEVVGRPLSAVMIPGRHVSAHDAGMAHFGRTGEGPVIGKRLELPVTMRDGSEMTAELSIGAFQSAEGYGAFAFIRDIRERLRAQEQLQDSEYRLSQVLGNIPAFVGYFGRDLRCRYANELGRRIQGLAEGQEIGLHLREAIGPEHYALHEPHIAQVLAGRRAQFEGAGLRDGHTVYWQAHMVPETHADGSITGFYLMTFDITAAKVSQLREEHARRRLRAIADNLPVMISYIDATGRIQFLNRTFQTWTGVAVDGALGQRLEDVIGRELFEQRRPALEQALAGQRVEFEVTSERLGVRRVLQTVYLPDMAGEGGVVGLYGLTTDVTVLRDAEARMIELAMTDALTRLPNRRQFEARLAPAMARAVRHRSGLALMFLDVDHFKRINDTYGHAAGDAILIAFGERLTACVRSTDTVARLAGDEFVVLLEGLHDPEECHVLANKVNIAARGAVTFDGHALTVTTSIGIAYMHETARCSPDTLLSRADEALYKTKERGRDGYTVTVADDVQSGFLTSAFGAL